MWYVFIVKLIDYIETVPFVVRKKCRQVSFLYVLVPLCFVGHPSLVFREIFCPRNVSIIHSFLFPGTRENVQLLSVVPLWTEDAIISPTDKKDYCRWRGTKNVH